MGFSRYQNLIHCNLVSLVNWLVPQIFSYLDNRKVTKTMVANMSSTKWFLKYLYWDNYAGSISNSGWWKLPGYLTIKTFKGEFRTEWEVEICIDYGLNFTKQT